MSASHQADIKLAPGSHYYLQLTWIQQQQQQIVCVVGWWGGGVGGLGVIIESNLNRVRLSCCWVGVGLGCDNMVLFCVVDGLKISIPPG